VSRRPNAGELWVRWTAKDGQNGSHIFGRADCGDATNWFVVGLACVAAVMLFMIAKRLWRRGGTSAVTGSVALYAGSAACIVLALLA
jgi:hypothetical protein